MATDERDRIIAALAALTVDPARWGDADPEELRQATYLGLMHYGATNDPAEVPRLVPLYNAVVRRSTLEERLARLEKAIAESRDLSVKHSESVQQNLEALEQRVASLEQGRSHGEDGVTLRAD